MDHTGATSTNGTLSEFKTTANDETILTAFTADNLTIVEAVSISADH